MAQRRSSGSRTKGLSSRGPSSRAKSKSPSSKIKAKPKLKGAKKLTAKAGGKAGKPVKPAAKRASKTSRNTPRKTARKTAAKTATDAPRKARNALPKAAKSTARPVTRAVQGRRPPIRDKGGRNKGGRPPAFDRASQLGVETPAEEMTNARRGRTQTPSTGYAFEEEPRQSAEESFTPGNSQASQVGEIKTGGRRAGRSRRRKEGIDGLDGAGLGGARLDGTSLDGAGELAESRDSEVARDTRDTASQRAEDDYGRAPPADSKTSE